MSSAIGKVVSPIAGAFGGGGGQSAPAAPVPAAAPATPAAAPDDVATVRKDKLRDAATAGVVTPLGGGRGSAVLGLAGENNAARPNTARKLLG